MFKSDRGGIEINSVLWRVTYWTTFKSDRGGIEIRMYNAGTEVISEFKSDRGGIEMKVSTVAEAQRIAFKSDRGGIEMCILSKSTKSNLNVQIRPWRDWNQKQNIYKKYIDTLFKSDRGGIEIPKPCTYTSQGRCSNQTVAGLKYR